MAGWRQKLSEGQVIPALPLALNEDGSWSETHQAALIRYYIDAGAGGLAVGVHSTQFEIREPEFGLFEPVLKHAQAVIDQFGANDFVRIAGICGTTNQALAEAELAIKYGYYAGLLSLAAVSHSPESVVLDHVRAVASEIPVIGFYLQPAVGGSEFSYRFWREFCDKENVVAIKMAPFNRYQTWDVVRAVIESGRDDISLYTGNDDNIIIDLLTPYSYQGKTRFIDGGLLGQWGVGTRRAVEMLAELKSARTSGKIASQWLSKNVALTDVNAAIFDAANGFAGCIPGILEVLRHQGLVPSNRCLNPEEKLSPGQLEELNRVREAWPDFSDDHYIRQNLETWLG